MDQNPTGPINSTPVTSPMPPVSPQAKGNTMKELILIVVLLVVLAGISYGSYWGYNAYQTKQITLGKVITNFINHIKNDDIKSVEFASSVDVKILGGDPVKSDVNAQYAQALSQFNNVGTTFSLNGIVDNTLKDNFKTYGKLNITINVDAKAGSQYAALANAGPLAIDLEYYVFPDSVYFRLNKIPSFVGVYTNMIGVNISEYLNEWIVVDKKYIDSFMAGFLKGSKGDKLPLSITDEQYSKLQAALIEFYDTSGAIVITDRKNETTSDGKAVTALYISFNNDKLLTGATKLAQELAGIFPDIFTNFDKTKTLDNPDFVKSIKAFSFTDLKFLVGSDGYLYGSSGTANVDATDSVPAISENIQNSLKNYNKQFNLQKPADAKDIALILMEIQDAMQRNSMKASVIQK